MTLLSVDGLSIDILARNGPRTVVDGLSFTIEAGELLALIGESGSGKSIATLSLMGLLPSPPFKVTGGTAVFEGRDLLHLPEPELRQLRGNRIGAIFQEPMSALDPMMSVGDQIAEVIVTHRGMTWSAARAEAVRLLDRVRIPDAKTRAQLHAGALSGGMRQRVVIAAAVACKPALIIADEPTTALDATVQAEILALLSELKAEVGCSVIFITHDMGVVSQIADRVLVMRDGRAIETGARDDVLSRPQAAYTRALIAASAPTVPSRGDVISCPQINPPALAVENLVVSYPRTRNLLSFGRTERVYAVDRVNLTVGNGETVALVGESGSGKTTIARAILGLVHPDAGRIRLAGEDITRATSNGRVQFVFQDPQSSLDPRYQAWRSVTEPIFIAGEKNLVRLRQRAAELFEQVDLDTALLDRLTQELSGGQRQRLGIARALSLKPDLVIADEAVSALDATTKLQVLELFCRLQAETGLPLLFITHDFSVVTRIAKRVAVMRFGRLVEWGPTASVLENPQNSYTRALIAASNGAKFTSPASQGHRTGIGSAGSFPPPMLEFGPGHFAAAEEHD